MATKINDTNQFFVFTWTIRHFSLVREILPSVCSPSFTTLQNNSREGQINWRLFLYNENGYITVVLRRLEDGEKECYLKCKMSLVDSDGLCVISDCKNCPYDNNRILLFNTFASTDRLFSDEKDRLVPNDELTIRCTIWPTEAKPETTGLCFGITELLHEVDYFFWTIEKFSSLERGEVRTFLRKPNLLSAPPATLKLFLSEDQNIQINVTYQDPTDLYTTFWAVSIVNALGQTVERKVANLDKEKYSKFISSQFDIPDCTSKTSDTEVNEKILNISLLTSKYKLTAQSDLFLTNDVLLLKFRSMKPLSSKILFDSRRTEKFCGLDSDIQKYITGTLTHDMKNLFNDGSFSDFNFLVGPKKFPVHKAVLCTRSFDNGAEVLRSDSWKNIRKHHILLASETAEYMFLKRN